MSQFRPPSPTLISSGGGSGSGDGSTISNESSSVSVVAGDSGDNINFTINEVVALSVDENRNVKIGGTNSTGAKLIVGDENGDCIKLVNTANGSYGTISLNSNSGITFGSSGSNVKFGNNAVFVGAGALRIGLTPVVSTAEQLNFTATTEGIAIASKALVVDSNRDIVNINTLAASSLTGTLTTGNQPNITNLNSVAINALTINGSSNGLISIDSNGNLRLTSANSIAISPHTDLLFYGDSNISGVASISATTISGTLTTGDQPNITSIGSLSLLDVSGDVSFGTFSSSSTSYRLTLNEPGGKLLSVKRSATLGCTFDINTFGDIVIVPTRNIKFLSGHDLTMGGDIIGVINLSADTIAGTLQTSDQPNITSIGTLSELTVANTITATSISVNTISGTLQTASQPNITSLGNLLNLSVTNTITTNNLSAVTLGGTIQTSSQPNITSIGTLSNLNVTNAINAESISAATLSGALQTSSQPKITTIGTLSNLVVTNTITTNSLIAQTVSGVLQTAGQPNITSVGTLSALSVTNGITANSVVATTMTGTLLTPSQPNVTSIGTLTSLVVSGAVTAESVSATDLSGTLQTAIQANITTVGTLNKLSTTGPIAIGVATPLNVIDIDTTSINIEPTISLTDGTNSVSLKLSTAGLKIETTGPYLTLGQDVSLRFLGGSLIGLNTITATDLVGTLLTSAQPNITLIGELEYLDSGYLGLGIEHNDMFRLAIQNVSGKMISMSNTETALTLTVVAGDYTFNTTNSRIALGNNVDLVLNGGTIIGLTNLEATNISGTLQTPEQPNITSLGSLTSLTVLGDSNLQNANILGDLTVDGSLILSTPLSFTEVAGESANFDADIEAISSTNGGTLTVIGGAAISKNLIVGTTLTVNGSTLTSSDIDALSTTSAGTVTAGTFLSVNETKTLTGFSNLQTEKMALGNTTNSEIPMEIGFSAFTMTQQYAYNTNFNSHGVLTPGANPASYNYSIRALGRILCTQSVDVMSDRRTKTNIEELSDDYCSTFVRETKPVSFNWKNGEDNKSFGYIAQDILRAGYPDLVNLVNDEDAEEIIDEDGFLSPAGIKFTVTYQHIIPILAKNQKRLLRENEELRAKLDTIMEMLASK